MTEAAANPVAPDAVRVWRGFRLPTLAPADFYSRLGTVFVPATVLMQIDVGLHSYTPTVPGGLEGKPDAVPDETAILFWESPATYWNGFTTLAVRTYTLTHNGVYLTSEGQSRADFPILFDGSVTADQPVYLIDKPADWMHGHVEHLVAARPAATDPDTFHTAVAGALGKVQNSVPLDGAIACVGADYVVYWELSAAAPGEKQGPSGIPIMLAACTDWSHVFTPAPTFVPVGLWDEWSGMDVVAGSSLNMQFTRRSAT
jgi:hypothetical protein